MKSVLISIKPKYCELIVLGLKTVELRKTKPKIETPFKCYIYQSKTVYVSKNKTNEFLKPIQDKRFGKVIGEFVCDKIDKIVHAGTSNENIQLCIFDDDWQYIPLSNEYLYQTQLSYAELEKYSNGGNLYGWHISNLVIYDEPKELREFGRECNLDCPSVRCSYWKYQRVNTDEWDFDCSCNNIKLLKRPPQSWCYVEEQ